MKVYEFLSIQRLKDKDDFNKKLKIGDKFLYGPRMISQIEAKRPGDEVSFYKVYNIKDNSVEYGVAYDTLEK